MTKELNTLYAYRSVEWESAEGLMKWAHSQGIVTLLPRYDFHVTVIYSKSPFLWDHEMRNAETLLIKGGKRSVEVFGDDALVLRIESPELEARHKELIAMGAVSDYPEYKPHITLTYQAKGIDVSQIVPYTGDIQLGCEWLQPIGNNPYGKSDSMTNHSNQDRGFQSYGKAQVVKVSPRLGLVFGYAIVSKVQGEDYYDHHGDHIPEDAMLKAAVNFMASERMACDMHERDENGEVVKAGQILFAYPMTQEIADSLDIVVKQTGLLVAMKPSPEVLKKFESGEYTGFSIGGRRIVDQEVI
jgi:hypothetical protein